MYSFSGDKKTFLTMVNFFALSDGERRLLNDFSQNISSLENPKLAGMSTEVKALQAWLVADIMD